MAYYPTLDKQTIKNLMIVKQLALEQPDYFAGSPYSLDVEKLLALDSGGKPAPFHKPAPSDDDELDVLEEIKSTYRDLKNAKPSNGDAAALQGYFRTKTSLLEKLLEGLERGKNQKQISEFYSTVVNLLEEISTPTQIAVFKERLSEFASN